MNTGNLIALGIVLVLWVLVWRSSKPKTLPDGTLKMRYGKAFWLVTLGFYATLGLFTTGFVGLLLEIGFQIDHPGTMFLLPVIAVNLFICVWLTLAALYAHVILSDKGIEVRTMFGRVRTMSWADVVTVVFTFNNLMFELTDRTGTRIKVIPLMTGMKEFIAYVSEHTPVEVHQEALKNYKSYTWFVPGRRA